MNNDALLEIERLVVRYGRGRKAKEVLHGVSLDILEGETVGLIGESGSGKTTIGRAIVGLAPVQSGLIRFAGQDITHASARERRRLSTDIQFVFQDPFSSLNPALTIEEIISEPMRVQGVSRPAAQARIRELLSEVGLPNGSELRRPRQFSGGQRQRIAIARALALQPRLIVCDEPVSALDLTTQARVLDLFVRIQEQTGVAYLFVTHDLSVVRKVSHRVSVIYRGDIVEFGSGAQVTSDPTHPYTRRLAAAAPVSDPARQAERRRVWRALTSGERAGV
jgi:peptide/nickel transport system ATP-binding protein